MRDEQIPVSNSLWIGGKARVISQVLAASGLAEGTELAVVSHPESNMAVSGFKNSVGYDIGMVVAIPPWLVTRDQVVARHIAQPRHLAFQQRHIDLLSLPRSFPLPQGGQNGGGGVHPGGDVHDCHPHLVRRAICCPCNAHDTALGLDDKVIARAISVGTIAAVARDGTVDQARIHLLQLIVTQSPTLHRPHAKVLDKHVATLHQRPEDGFSLLGLQVEGQTLLVPVGAQIVCAFASSIGRAPLPAIITSARHLDLDYLGTQVAEHHRAVGTG